MTKPIHHTCAKCAKPFIGRNARKYCSRECARQDRGPSWNAGTTGGKGRPFTQVDCTCQGCGDTFSVHKHRSKDAKFCNMTCYHRTRWSGTRSDTAKCETCGNPFRAFDCEARKFCSHPCYVASGNGAMAGSSSHQWKGGTSQHYKRGPDWKAVAERARSADGHKCRGCGKQQAEMSGTRKSLDVHHIVPWSVSNSNALENLVTLCRSCHHRAEPRPETVKWLRDCVTHQKAFLEQERARWGLL